MSGSSVTVVEAEESIGTHASSRNSEVVHAGIYYPPASLKARSCIHGKKLLYQYCVDRGIAHKAIGKLLVACSKEDEVKLHQIQRQATACGVTDLRLLDRNDIAALEPQLNALSGVLSPSTGIVDSHQLLQSLLADLISHNGHLVLASPVTQGAINEGVWLRLDGNSDCDLQCNLVINCTGLYAPEIATLIQPTNKAIPTAYFAHGQYYAVSGPPPFTHLIYPMPSNAGLGIHATPDLSGAIRFGPDVQWLDTIDYAFNEQRESTFRAAIAEYYPGIEGRELRPAHTGIRAKIVAQNQSAADFIIDSSALHSGKGLINLFGIESPGLTASLALAEHVAQLVKHQ